MKLLTGSVIWERITELAQKRRKALVAVPYVGKGAAKMLPLKSGSVLVTRFEKSAIRAGQVCPDDIIALIKGGVRVFNHPALHAKVYVFGQTVILGSSNASHTSRDRLVEACIESTDKKIASEASDLVLELANDEIELASAMAMREEYREPQTFPLAAQATKNPKRKSIRRDELTERPLWLGAMHPLRSSSAEMERAGDLALEMAAPFTDDEQRCEYMLCRQDERDVLEVGDMVINRYRDVSTGEDYLMPPAKILAIRKVKGINQYAVAYAQRKRARDREMEAVAAKIGDKIPVMLNLKRAMRAAGKEERAALLRLWSIRDES